MVSAGIDRATIHVGRSLPVPRASQNTGRPWDILVLEEDMPVAAIDIKTPFGSIRNNIRNRMNDTVAARANVARAFDQKAVRALKPAVGQLFLLEERWDTTDPIRPRQTFLSTFAPAGPPESVQDQFRAFFRRLLNDEMYDAVCFLTSTAPPNVNVREPDPAMGFASFATKIAERVEDIREAHRGSKIQAAELGRKLAERDDLSAVVAGLSDTNAGRLTVDLDVIH
ncbi:PaeR7I family type II restriction endonuclease [Amycolatopsis sp. A133]|uniref:PaeR7I family type II restriction endonuclease n=1 Tax=Amycolatopsis sp. A133 TaxID=3064472 RepID=UPI0027E793DE|nr:PaeR7I family type II restriction endonuclease [Amycolatopsis sp. A133]MDQ7802681.1 PaeR7I family type II restriction endonuclease [Amycolatopsis sp. A133]